MLQFAYLAKVDTNFNDDEVKSVAKIRSGDKETFEKLFFKYHSSLILFANTITKSKELARDCVQDVFLKIWRNRKEWNIQYSLKAYLYQSVRNQALNLLEKKKARLRLIENYQKDSLNTNETFKGTYEHLTEKEARQLKRIWELVEEMPERRRLAFDLNRRHGLSYKEISKVLDISRKTVENHIGQAIRFIKDKINLEDFS